MSECKWFSVCPMKRFFERGLLEEKFILSYCKGDWSSCIRYQKEEAWSFASSLLGYASSAGIYHPDNMRQDGVIDENLS